MGREIVWSQEALDDISQILEYWDNRTKSTTYSRKLYLQIKDLIYILSLYPYLGIQTNKELSRVKIFKEYKIFYFINPNSLEILKIWDKRQNPKNIKY